MRYILLFWALPLGLFWGWFALSYHDMHFGYVFLSRLVHDFVFEMYGSILGIDPAIIPPMVAKATILDTAIIFGIFGFRRRDRIRAWWEERRSRVTTGGQPSALPAAGQAPPAE